MPAVTRRRYPERPDCWHVYCGEVQAGTIARRVGNPVDTDSLGVDVRLLSGIEAGRASERHGGNLRPARADFEQAWQIFLSKRTEAHFQAWHNQRAFTTWKYAMHDAGLPLPTQMSNGRERCFCGVAIDIKDVGPHIRETHMTDQHPA